MQFVQIKNIKSSLLSVLTGVPQGSILVLLLFITYLSDFTNTSNIFKMILYANDSKLSAELSDFANLEIRKILLLC